jgi:hypothetical protein
MDTVLFARSTGAPVVVTLHLTGCRFATSTLSGGPFWPSASTNQALHALDPDYPA